MIARFVSSCSVILVVICGVACSAQPDFSKPDFLITSPAVSHPSDVIKFDNRYVATELYSNRLAVFDDLDAGVKGYFNPESIGKRFWSPHFLAISPWGTLLISNGWGSSIVDIADLEGSQWKEFRGIDKKLNAPHGICVDAAGWIYVGDSLNSRLVRFRDMDGADWEVFKDIDRRVSYIRELDCADGVVWAANSYERREGLNPGKGANILKITDFESGNADVFFEFPDTNITGLLPLGEDSLLVGMWGPWSQLALLDGHTKKLHTRLNLGPPYGIYQDQETGQVIVAHIGINPELKTNNTGGIAVFSK